MPVKTCPKCREEAALRTRACNCGYEFPFKNKHKKSRAKLKDLRPGDRIKVSGGPYYLTEKGDKIRIGYRGQFVVLEVCENYVVASGRGKNAGEAIIYMGKKEFIRDTSIHREPHKIYKLSERN